MKWAIRLLLGVIFLSLTAAFCATSSAPARPRGQWESLFNGKNLEGWKAYGTETWVVDHKTILGESSSGKYGYLKTTKDYTNFMLRLEFKCETVGNSGLFFHSRIIGENPKWGPDIVGMRNARSRSG
jgi:Domain of Unknown Function (DUF1080)